MRRLTRHILDKSRLMYAGFFEDGYCYHFALATFRYARAVGLRPTLRACNDRELPGHVWVEIDGFHIDGVATSTTKLIEHEDFQLTERELMGVHENLFADGEDKDVIDAIVSVYAGDTPDHVVSSDENWPFSLIGHE